jgi:hypothetical protein
MPFLDHGSPPFVREYFKDGDRSVGPIMFCAHGAWRPHIDGMVKVQYTYYWYTQPNTTLSFEKYKDMVGKIHTKEPVDSIGPGSGAVSNYAFFRLEQPLLGWTIDEFVKEKIEGTNIMSLRLLIFTGSVSLKAFSLKLLDQQLLPWLRIPQSKPVRMIVCRALQTKVQGVLAGEWTGL